MEERNNSYEAMEVEANEGNPDVVEVDSSDDDAEAETKNSDNHENVKKECPQEPEGTDDDSAEQCPICMDNWTNTGEHRLCCLRCGHLFGHSCIIRWLEECPLANRRCPHCSQKARIKDIRFLYARKLTTVDTCELEKLKRRVEGLLVEKQLAEMELLQCRNKQKMYDSEFGKMRARIAELESQKYEVSQRQWSVQCPNRKFHLERTLEICKEEGCRVLDYNPWYGYLVVSQKSINNLFSGYGVRKVNCDKFQPMQFVFLHTKGIRDISFHPTQQEQLLSVSFDKSAKLMNIHNNAVIQSYSGNYQLWSCCWSAENSNVFFVGNNNGTITQFDVRQAAEAVATIGGHGDISPVISLAPVAPSCERGLSRGGFLACQLNTAYAYVQKDCAYHPKELLLEGPFVSVCYDEKNKHALVSARPNSRHQYARHMVCTFDKSPDDSVLCNVVHTFQAGSSFKLMSRPCHVNLESDTLVAAYQEHGSCIPLWSVATGKQVHSLVTSDPVVDMCSFKVKNSLFLTTLSTKKLRLFSYA